MEPRIDRGNDAEIRVQDSFSALQDQWPATRYLHSKWSVCTVILVDEITKIFPARQRLTRPLRALWFRYCISAIEFPLTKWLIMPAFICAMIVSAFCKLCYCRCYPLLFLLLLIPLSYRYLHQRLCRNKHDRLETLTQCGERPRFAFQHFFGNLTRGHKIWAHRNFNALPLSATDMATSHCSYTAKSSSLRVRYNSWASQSHRWCTSPADVRISIYT